MRCSAGIVADGFSLARRLVAAMNRSHCFFSSGGEMLQRRSRSDIYRKGASGTARLAKEVKVAPSTR